MTNNDIFKKLRVALQLRDEQIIDILELVDFRISKAELGAFFRAQNHPNYMECGDQVLRNFLNGLVIHLRGTKDNPTNAMDVINKNKEGLKTNATANKSSVGKEQRLKNDSPKKPYKKKSASGSTPKIQVVEKVKFNNGKHKKN